MKKWWCRAGQNFMHMSWKPTYLLFIIWTIQLTTILLITIVSTVVSKVTNLILWYTTHITDALELIVGTGSVSDCSARHWSRGECGEWSGKLGIGRQTTTRAQWDIVNGNTAPFIVRRFSFKYYLEITRDQVFNPHKMAKETKYMAKIV